MLAVAAEVLPAAGQTFPHQGRLTISEGLLLVRAPVLYGDPALAESQTVNSLVNIKTLRVLISSSWRDREFRLENDILRPQSPLTCYIEIDEVLIDWLLDLCSSLHLLISLNLEGWKIF